MHYYCFKKFLNIFCGGGTPDPTLPPLLLKFFGSATGYDRSTFSWIRGRAFKFSHSTAVSFKAAKIGSYVWFYL